MMRRPNRKEDPIRSVISTVDTLMQHEALSITLENNEQAKTIIADINEELRCLKASLTGYEYNNVDQTQLNKWCADRHTTRRLNHLLTTLDLIKDVKVAQDNAHASTPPQKDKWELINSKDIQNEFLSLSLTHHIQHLRLGSDITYAREFIQYTGLEDLTKRQQVTATKLKLALKHIKDSAADVISLAKKVDSLAEKAVSISKTTSHTAHAGAVAAHVGPAEIALHSAPALGAVLTAIPIIGAAVMTIDPLIKLVRSKTNSDRAFMAVMTGVGLAAIAFTVAFPVAAAGIAAGMIAANVVTNYVKPFLDVRKKIKGLENDIKKLDGRIEELEQNNNLSLNQDERSFLIQRVQRFYVENKDVSIEDLSEAKRVIQTGSMTDIQQNALLKKSLPENQTMQVALQGHHRASQTKMTNEIASLKKTKNMLLAQSVNGIFTVIGAALMAVPFPPVMIAGAAVLVASSVAGIVIKYHEQIATGLKKIFNGIKKIFSAKTKDHEIEKQNENDITLNASVNLTASAPPITQQTQHKSHAQPMQPATEHHQHSINRAEAHQEPATAALKDVEPMSVTNTNNQALLEACASSKEEKNAVEASADKPNEMEKTIEPPEDEPDDESRSISRGP